MPRQEINVINCSILSEKSIKLCGDGIYSLKAHVAIKKIKLTTSWILAHCGLFIDRNLRDNRGTTVYLNIAVVFRQLFKLIL